MTRLTFFVVFVFCAAAVAQDVGAVASGQDGRLRLALCVANDNLSAEELRYVANKFAEPFAASGLYRVRSDIFLLPAARERIKQEGGGANLAEILAIGRSAGAAYVCVVELVQAFGKYNFSAQMFDAAASEAYLAAGQADIADMGGIDGAAREVFGKMHGVPAVAPQAADGSAAVEAAPAEPVAPPEPLPTVESAPEPAAAIGADSKPRPAGSGGLRMSVGVGGSFACNFGGGITWMNPPVEQLTMPYIGGSGYLFFDAVYAEIFAGYFSGGGKWASPNASDSRTLPELRRSVVNLGVFAKYPLSAGALTAFPLAGVEYDFPVSIELIKSAELKSASGLASETKAEAGDLAALTVRLGLGFDFGLGDNAYLRLSALYGLRAFSALEGVYVDAVKDRLNRHDAEANIGHGLVLRVGVGYKL
ncbi:hypothetical protein R80B4_03017 [Fibrobacteres bacterium R8-0-B4]